jgi:hypothetical protein
MGLSVLFMDRKGSWYEEGPQYFFVIVLLVAVILALVIRDTAVTYSIAFLIGAIFGKNFYQLKHKVNFPMVMVCVAFFLGLALPSEILSKASWKWILVFYIFGGVLAYQLYQRKILRTSKI